MGRDTKAVGMLGKKRRPTGATTKPRRAPKPKHANGPSVVNRESRLAALTRELQEATERQTATSEILRVISQSPTDVKPVFEAIAQTAVRLLGCDRAFIQRCDSKSFWSVAWCGPEGQLPMLNNSPVPIDPAANFPSRAISEKMTLYLPDWSAI